MCNPGTNIKGNNRIIIMICGKKNFLQTIEIQGFRMTAVVCSISPCMSKFQEIGKNTVPFQ